MDAAQQQENTGKSIKAFLEPYRKNIGSDMIAGLTGAVAGAPQAMGFAILAGISPIYGLYTAIVSTIIGAFTTGSTYMTVGPTNAVALVVGTTLLTVQGTNPEANPIEYLFVLTLLVGVFQLLFGILKLGQLTQFVSNAVMTGFITGAGLLIINGQLRSLTGYALDKDTNFWQPLSGSIPSFVNWVTKIPQTDFATLFIGALTIGIIIALRPTRFKNAGILIALAASTIVVQVAGWESVPLVRDTSLIPSGLPSLVIPNLALVPDLIVPAIALAILALVQSAGLVQAIPEPDEGSITRDFIGQGVANIGSAFFQGMPSGGSLSRTAVNINAGAKTRLSNVFAGLFIAIVVIALANVIELVPMAALAGQLVVAAWSLIRVNVIKMVWRISWTARLSMLATFISTLILPLEYSIYIGVSLSLALYIYSSAAWIQIVHLVKIGEHQYKEEAMPTHLPEDKVIVFSVYGHLFFAAVRRLEAMLPDPETANHTVVILRLRNNPYMGSTGLNLFRDYARKLDKHNSKLILTGIGEQVHKQFERTHKTAAAEDEPFEIFYANGIIFSATEKALDYAEEWLHPKSEGD